MFGSICRAGLCAAGAVTLLSLAADAQDLTPPRLVSAGSLDGLQIGVCFSEPMSSTGLAVPTNYSVTDSGGTALVTNVSVRSGGDTVELSMSRAVTGTFTVRANNLSDPSGNPLAAGASVTARVWGAGLGLADVGAPLPAGDFFTCEQDRVTIRAGDGVMVSSSFDRISYLYLLRTNDFDLAVRIDSLSTTGSLFPSAALMVRASLGADSASLAAAITPTNGANFLISRVERGDTGAPSFFYWQRTANTFPVWLRLKRTGPVFFFYASADGLNWSALGTPLRNDCIPFNVFVGLATVSTTDVPAVADYRSFGDTRLSSNAVVQITSPPAGVTLEENMRGAFAVAATVANAQPGDLHYQWQTESSAGSGAFTNIFGAWERAYTTAPLHLADNGRHLRAVIGVSGSPDILSPAATLLVNPDVTGPRLISTSVGRSLREVFLTFSEAIKVPAATTLANYRVAGQVVTNVVLQAGGAGVILSLAARITPGANVQVTATNLTDLLGHPLAPLLQTLTVHAPEITRGFAVEELYYCLPGGQVSDLTSAPKFPHSPDQLSYVPSLEGPAFFTDFYGTRLSGFLIPPVTGGYNFWLSSDDAGEFWLSTDDDPAHMVRLCIEPEWDGFREFISSYTTSNLSSTVFPAGVPLVAGQSYAFQALSKEAAGGDHVSVAWQIPGSTAATNGSAPISTAYLASLVETGFASITIAQQPVNVAYPPAGGGGTPRTLFSADFKVNAGGFNATFEGAPEGGWTHSPQTGWTAVGSEAMPGSTKMLTGPQLAITRAGEAQLRFAHRFIFDVDRVPFDGGQIRLRVNGGPFQALNETAFLTNGYPGYIFGLHALDIQWGFGGQSAGYASGSNIVTVASLGSFVPGDTVAVQFLGAWDIGTLATAPNWAIDNVSISEGNPAPAQATFSARAVAVRRDGQPQAIVAQWQRDCGSGFADIPQANDPDFTFVPTPADGGCRFRCLFRVPGASTLTDAAALSLGAGPLTIERNGGGVVVRWSGTGHLQNAATLKGAWTNVTAATSPYAVPAQAETSFYRLIQP